MQLISRFTVPIAWSAVVKRTARHVYDGHCFGWAAALAYYSFLALFPALLFVVSLASFFPIQKLIDQAMRTVVRFAPGDVVTIVRDQLLQITDTPHGGVLVLSLLGTVWSTSSGMVALIATLNQAHDVFETRPWWRVRAVAVALTTALAFFMLVALTLVLVGPATVSTLADRLELGAAFTMGWHIVRWPAALAVVLTALGAIYHFAPDVKQEFAWITPGSVAATAVWLLVSLAFRTYVVHFGTYQKTYGAIGAVMVTLLWFYFSGLAVILGAQLNATIAEASAAARSARAELDAVQNRMPATSAAASVL
jgi:membrane protein